MMKSIAARYRILGIIMVIISGLCITQLHTNAMTQVYSGQMANFSVATDSGGSYTLFGNAKIKVIIFGNIVTSSYSRTGAGLANSLAYSLDGSKVEFIYLDIGNSPVDVKSYFNANSLTNLIACSSDGVQSKSKMWSSLRNCGYTSNSVYIPCIFILDGSCNFRYYSTDSITYEELLDNVLTLAGSGIYTPSESDLVHVVKTRNAEIYSNARADVVAQNYYLAPSASIQSDNASITAKANEITAGIAEDYSKLSAIYDWVRNNIYYDYDYFYGNSNILFYDAVGVLENKRSVCYGYANLFAALTRAAGIPCKMISGYALGVGTSGLWTDGLVNGSEINHSWNEAYVNGEWILLDVTWDSGNKYENSTYVKQSRNRTYFDCTMWYLSEKHKIVISGEDARIPFPDIDITTSFILDGNTVRGVMPGTYLEGFNAEFHVSSGYTSIVKKDGLPLLSGSKIGTGMKVQIMSGSTIVKEYSIIIFGDATGDGNINALDLLAVKRHILGLHILSGASASAANTDHGATGSINALDLLKIKRHILGLENIVQ